VLYSEAQSGVVVTCKKDHLEKVEKHFKDSGIPAFEIGQTKGTDLKVNDLYEFNSRELKEVYENVISSSMNVPI
jgi:predicted lipase